MLALPLLLAAASIPLTPLPNARVGEVQGTRAFVAVSVDHGRVRVYVCDGTLKRDATIATWFKGRWDGRSPLTLKANGHTLRLRGATGSFDGHAFRVKLAKNPAGLWDGRDGKLRTTWIVLANRRMRGTFVPTRPPRCRVVAVTGPNGDVRYVSTCG